MASIVIPLLFLTRIIAEEVGTPSSLLGPRNYNHHPFSSKYLQALESAESTKKGPVLFPNDAPPAPRPPLIVTSRPLIDSIVRSELNPAPQNNSLPQSSQVNNVIRPFLARIKDYRPFAYVATPAPEYQYEPYRNEGRYEDYEPKPVLPPIYKVFADHAKQKVAKIKEERNKNRYDYQVKVPEYYHQKTNKENIDDEEGKNYAFSYRVNDKETGDDFSHIQRSSGSATNGEYRVRLPDGRMQIVSYTADENGYQADVRYADDDKTNVHKDDHYDYSHNRINDNHNTIDNNHNDYNEKHNIIDSKYEDYIKHPYDYKNDYVQQRDYKIDDGDKYKSPANDYYNQYADNSKEYYNDDFSKEYESKTYDYAPHKSKYSAFLPTQSTFVPKPYFASSTTVKPSYEDLKDLLVTKKAYNTVQNYDNKIPVTISVPSTTASPYQGTTERVVLIGGKKTNFYTNIHKVPLNTAPILVTPSPIKFVTSDYSVSPTPMTYLVSTINSLRNKVDLSGPKPVLSNSYIDRINKYLSFN